jgi:hypothetical protein
MTMYEDDDKDWMDDLTPEQLQEWAQMGMTPERLKELRDQIEYAKSLRDMQQPAGIQAGETYLAANPMEHIGALMSRFAGRKMEKTGRAAVEEQLNKLAELRARAYANNRGGAAATPMTPEEALALRLKQMRT